MFRRMLAGVLSMGILLFLAIPAAAQTGSIRVETTGGTVALYKVGEINGQSFNLYPEYGGATLGQEDILSANLAAWLNEQAKNGVIKATDIWGDTIFDGLEPGLYLIAQPSTPSGQSPFDPFLIALPWDGYVWEVNVDLELLPPTGESPMPDIWLAVMFLSIVGIGICMPWKRKLKI